MSRTRVPVVFMGLFLGALAVASVAGGGTRAFAADEKSDTDQAVLKMNAQCNEAELRADIAGMEACETDDFMHIHANGMVEHKAGFLKGIASGAHKFLALDL